MNSATISFGLVSVPVNFYSATESTSKISFNWIHKRCGSRVKQQYFCPQDEEVVERDEMMKGYEIAKGQYALFSTEELKAVEEPKGSNTVDITEFVPFEQIERLYLDKVYYLGPAKGGERAYRLLAEAMKDTGLSAVAKYSARGKQYLVVVRPQGDGLALEQLSYSHEIRPFSEVEIPDTKVKKEELKLATQLIKQGASKKFDPTKYTDEVRDRQLALIQDKVDGKDITQAPQEEPQTQIIDLMDALKKSLAKEGGDASERKPAKRAERKGKRTTKRKKASSG